MAAAVKRGFQGCRLVGTLRCSGRGRPLTHRTPVVWALGGVGIAVGGPSWWSLPFYNCLAELLSGLDPDETARFATRVVPAEPASGAVDAHRREALSAGTP